MARPRNKSSRKSRFEGGSASATFIALSPRLLSVATVQCPSRYGSRQASTPKDRVAEGQLVEPCQPTDPPGKPVSIRVSLGSFTLLFVKVYRTPPGRDSLQSTGFHLLGALSQPAAHPRQIADRWYFGQGAPNSTVAPRGAPSVLRFIFLFGAQSTKRSMRARNPAPPEDP